MQIRKITRRINALEGPQKRFLIHLDCGHTVSLGRIDILSLRDVGDRDHWECEICPTPTTVREKSANELWKEAGEP